MRTLGLDIGGANLKASDGESRSVARGFAIWRSPERLAGTLREIVAAFHGFDLLAVTMTAELADCFSTKAEGVDFILEAVENVAGGKRVFVWQTGSEFVPSEEARSIPLLVAAANWHALATWVGRMVPRGSSILIDVGSTTSDIIPLEGGVPVPRGMTDRERLESGELVYTGVRRTPLCALARSVGLGGNETALAAELFAVTLDIYLLLGSIPEDPVDCDTANGRPATREAAHDRIARMLCCDRTELSRDEAEQMARFLADVQRRQIVAAVERVAGSLQGACASVLISGSGAFLAEQAAGEAAATREAELFRLPRMYSPAMAEAACAYAVARLAAERISTGE